MVTVLTTALFTLILPCPRSISSAGNMKAYEFLAASFSVIILSAYCLYLPTILAPVILKTTSSPSPAWILTVPPLSLLPPLLGSLSDDGAGVGEGAGEGEGLGEGVDVPPVLPVLPVDRRFLCWNF